MGLARKACLLPSSPLFALARAAVSRANWFLRLPSWCGQPPAAVPLLFFSTKEMSYQARQVKIGGGSPKCPTCGKSVFFNEQVLAIEKAWHKRCLKCNQCGKVLDPGSLSDRDGAPPFLFDPRYFSLPLRSFCSNVYLLS